MEKLIKRLGKAGMLKWIYHVKPKTTPDDYVPWGDPEDI